MAFLKHSTLAIKYRKEENRGQPSLKMEEKKIKITRAFQWCGCGIALSAAQSRRCFQNTHSTNPAEQDLNS